MCADCRKYYLILWRLVGLTQVNRSLEEWEFVDCNHSMVLSVVLMQVKFGVCSPLSLKIVVSLHSAPWTLHRLNGCVYFLLDLFFHNELLIRVNNHV